jgi:D-alanine-D-alanine ligase
MPSKITVGILFGGKSAEHEVSLQSAKNIYEAIDKSKYNVKLIGIDKAGLWHLNDGEKFILNANNPDMIKLRNIPGKLALVPGEIKHQ